MGDTFKYLPQLIVAYDGNDKFANLIHVQKANKDNNYLCPCCGGSVKPRALDSTKEQSHYYHISGKCTKESQLHFFCKNWLFEKNSKFYIDEELFEVDYIDIEKSYNTPFGQYIPDVTVYTTSGKVIYFEMFFTNRKTSDDYFCKWSYLGNDVVEINIKEYMSKVDEDTIPTFKYLYHDGICYSKSYVKRDLYADTIGRRKHELSRQDILDYKSRIERLDWFWQKIISHSPKEEILEAIKMMTYDDMLFCYSIIKRKQCVSYLKDDVLNLINEKVVSDIRDELNLPYDENIYFDLQHTKGRTYQAGVRLKLKTKHITYDDIPNSSVVVFNKNVLSKQEVIKLDDNIEETREYFNDRFNECVEKRKRLLEYEEALSDFERDKYQIKMNNNLYTVLLVSDGKYELLFENVSIEMSISKLSKEIHRKILKKENAKFLKQLFNSSEYKSFINKCKEYKDINIDIDIRESRYDESRVNFKMYICGKKVYDEILEKNMDDFIIKRDESYTKINEFINKYSVIIPYVDKINNSKNDFWKASFSFTPVGNLSVKVDQKIFIPRRYITFSYTYFNLDSQLENETIINSLKTALCTVMKNMERCGYRLLEERV